MTRTAIYARISADPEGRALGIARQVEDCRALVADRLAGYEVVEVFEENDVSASTNSRKPRPRYADMLARAEAGEIEAIVAYSNSRLTRRPREVEDLIDLHNRRGVRLHTVVSGDDDLSTADGVLMARLKASIDAAEAERTSERARRAKAQAAAEGRHRGGPRPFGWEADGMTVREPEAEALRKAARGVLAGRTLASLARELNASGMTTTTGRAWTYGALSTALCRPRNAGLVSHGKTGRPGVTIVGPGAWEPIVSEDVWRAVCDVLMDPARRKQQGNERRWLGSGLYRCGLCAAEGVVSVLRAAPYGGVRADGERRYLYRCTRTAHLTVSQEPADLVVVDAVCGLLASPDLGRLLADEHHEREGVGGGTTATLREERETLRARLATFEADYIEGRIDGALYGKATAGVQARIDDVARQLAQRVGGGPLATLAASPDPVRAFLGESVGTRQAVVDALAVVTIEPSTAGGDIDARVGIRWHAARS